jgi:hypothetical protein
MSVGEIAYLGLVLTGFTVFTVVLFWVSRDDRARHRRPSSDAALESLPSRGVTAV